MVIQHNDTRTRFVIRLISNWKALGMQDNFTILLNYSIELEKAKKGYLTSDHDREIIEAIMEEIRRETGVNVQYLAQLSLGYIKGSGEIIRKYINQIDDGILRSDLLHHMVRDRIDGCAETVYQLYMRFKNSERYIPVPGQVGPVEAARFDNSFWKLKPKKLKQELISFAHNHRDAYYLAFTMGTLASWRIPELESVFASFLDGSTVTSQSVGLTTEAESFHPPFSMMKRQLKFRGIVTLKYYPSENTIKLLNDCLKDEDKEIRAAAQHTLDYIEKHKKRD